MLHRGLRWHYKVQQPSSGIARERLAIVTTSLRIRATLRQPSWNRSGGRVGGGEDCNCCWRGMAMAWLSGWWSCGVAQAWVEFMVIVMEGDLSWFRSQIPLLHISPYVSEWEGEHCHPVLVWERARGDLEELRTETLLLFFDDDERVLDLWLWVVWCDLERVWV